MKSDLKIQQRDIGDLVPYARNSRTHSDEQVAQIAASIKEFGWTNPVLVDGENGIIAGHGRVMAARKLGQKRVPCIELSHLSETQKRAYIIVDNKLALNAGWDESVLSNELAVLESDGFELGTLGFSESELSNLMFDGEFGPGSEDEQGQLDEKAPNMVTCPNCGTEFDANK